MSVWKGNRQETRAKLPLSDTKNGMMWPQHMQLHRQICGSFITVRLLSPQLSISTGHLTRGTCTVPASKSQTSPEKAALYKINFIFRSRKYKFPHQPLSSGRRGHVQLRGEAQPGGSFPCALSQGFWLSLSTEAKGVLVTERQFQESAAMCRDWLWSQITLFIDRCNILCHCMVEVSLCHFPLEKIMLISYKILRSVDLLLNISVSYYFPFQGLPYLSIVIKHATQKIKPCKIVFTPMSHNSCCFSIWQKKLIKGQQTVFATVIIRVTSPNAL